MEARSEDVTPLPRLNGRDGGETVELPRPRSKLKFALRRARLDEAERSGVIAELRGAEIARLEMLRDEIAPLLNEIPRGNDTFDFGLVSGEHPRLFIDMIGFVEMGRDRRAYNFVQDTRHGRIVLAESERIEPMVEAVTNYVARRFIEREKALAADTTIETAARTYAETQKPPVAEPVPEKRPPKRIFVTGMALVAELIGTAVLVTLVAIGAREVWKYALAWWIGQ